MKINFLLDMKEEWDDSTVAASEINSIQSMWNGKILKMHFKRNSTEFQSFFLKCSQFMSQWKTGTDQKRYIFRGDCKRNDKPCMAWVEATTD